MFDKWKNNNESIGKKGSESGVILIEEELPDKSRITIEKVINKQTKTEYFAITFGITERLFHTAYFKNIVDAKECSDSLKLVIQVLLDDEQVGCGLRSMHPGAK